MTQISKFFACLLLLVGMSSTKGFAQDTAALDKNVVIDRIVVQVNGDEPKSLNLALNNVQNLLSYYKDKGAKVQIEVVAFGPGLHMLRADTSPVKDRVAAISIANPEVQFSACGNTLANMAKQEGSTPPLMSEAKPVDSGVVRIVELQKQGYSYLRP